MKYMRHPTISRGFLPNVDPMESLPQTDFCKKLKYLEDLSKDLPKLLEKREFRKTIDEGIDVHDFSSVEEKSQLLDKLMLMYSFFASAYVHEDPENPATTLPYCIAMPLITFSSKLKRPPILSYDSYCLCNWKRKKKLPIEVDNLELIQNFLGGKDEDWFILIHVDIEARASSIIEGIAKAFSCISEGKSDELLDPALEFIACGLYNMNITMDRMPEHCDPAVYYKRVRPYIFSFENVSYEKINKSPVTYRGETGAQSSIIPAVITALGIKHEESMLTKHLKDMRRYMPIEHREYLDNISLISEKCNIREEVIKLNSKRIKNTYNQCISSLIKFRDTHFNYAIEYIQKRVDNPTGTGGTPYIKWLGKLKEETEKYILS